MASKFLNANTDTTLGGSSASDIAIPSQKAVKTYVDGKIVEPDNLTITENSDNELQTVATLNQNDTTEGLKTWSGTKAEYDAITTKDSDTIYYVSDSDLDEAAYHPPILTPYWFDHTIEDTGWLNADTFSWHSGTTYSTVYNELLSEYNNTSSTTETEDSITFKRTPKGYKIALADQETAITTKFISKGIAWYYILDTTNTRFKLPRTEWGFEGLRDNVGDDIEESLPNIKGYVSSIARINDGNSGVFSSSPYYTSANSGVTTGGTGWGINFNASNSSSTYQDGAPVQERATQMYLYFYVGEYTRAAIEQTAGINTSTINNKVDLSCTNLSIAGKELISGLGLPSSSYIDLTLGASGATYTAPANGYIIMRACSGSSSSMEWGICNDTTGVWNIIVTQATASWTYTWVPVSEGDNYRVVYGTDHSSVTKLVRFMYLNGDQP